MAPASSFLHALGCIPSLSMDLSVSSSLKYGAPLPLKALFHETPPSRYLNRPESALLKSRVVSLFFHLPPCPLDPELYHFRVTAAKNELRILREYEVQQSTSPHWLFCHLQEVVQQCILGMSWVAGMLCSPSRRYQGG